MARPPSGPVLLVGLPDSRVEQLAGEFESRGFDPVRLDSGEQCRQRLAADGVAGIVVGATLPDTSGIELLTSIRTSRPALPVVLDASPETDPIAEQVVAQGVSLYARRRTAPTTVVDRFQDTLEDDAPGDEDAGRYRSLLETSPAPINIFDAEGRTVWGNDAVLDLLGLASRDDLIGRSIFEFIHPDYEALARSELADVIREGTSLGPTFMQLVREDGDVLDIWVSTAPGRFEGEPVGQAVVVDVTSLQDAYETVREERRFIEQALDTLHDVFYVVGPDGTLRRWNDAALDVTGYTPAELADSDVETLFVPEHRERVRRSIETVLAEGGDEVRADVLTADGRTIPFEFRGRRLTDDGGEVLGVVGTGRDVSHRVERERHLRVIEQFLRHNIRTNVNVVLGHAELIRADEGTDVAASVEAIEESGRRLLEMADRERAIVELITDPPDPVAVDLGERLRESVADVRERYPGVTVELPDPPSVAVRAVPRVRAALFELLENAVTHVDADRPRVSVSVRRRDDRVDVLVRDDGPGIPDLERRVLSPDQEIGPLNHGSGLGLWYVYWVVHLSGGTIDFEDGGEWGTTVVVTLPVDGGDGE